MADRPSVQLGDVQETLFIPLAARARAAQRRHPVLRDPRAVELVSSIDYDTARFGRGAGGFVTVLRTAISTSWPPGRTSRPGGNGPSMTRAPWSA